MIFHLYIKGVKMKKWSEIKQATLNKLFMTEAEARQQLYLANFQGYANECLNIIANGVKPRIVGFSFRVFDKIVYGNDFVYDAGRNVVTYTPAALGNGEREQITPDKTTIYYQDDDNKFTMTNGTWLLDKGAFYINDRVIMPEDFLSFADMINYHNNKPWNDIVYLSDREIAVGETGQYVIYYNALWEDITEEDIKNDNALTTHLSVLNCLPTYIASQCLAQDDVQRSASLRNEFESMLSRLDTNVMYQGQHYQSKGGWY